MSVPTPLADTTLRKAVILLSFLAVGAVLYVAKGVFIPVAVALFLSLLLTPAVDRLQRWRLPRALAVAVVMFVVFAAAAAAVNAVWTPATEWLARAPQTLRKIDPRLKPVREMFARFDAVAERAGQLTQRDTPPASTPAIVTPVDEESTAISFTRTFFECLTIIPLTLFFLLGGQPLLARMGATLAGSAPSARAVRLTEAIRSEVGRYFGTIALINVGLGAATALAFTVLGMPNAILWGILAAVLNFVPYVGPIAACLIFACAALVTFEDLAQALSVPGVFVALHLLEGQLVQPLTVGRRLEVNALVVLLAVWFGYGFWGIPGILLATPVLVALKVAAQLRPEWRVLRDFLAPIGDWPSRAFRRTRVAKDGNGKSASDAGATPD